ncbi:MAG: arginine deiminase-related protein [Steroidobacteraceae bacterium]
MSDAQASDEQVAHHVLMIRPANFSANAETAASNRFQNLEAGAESLDPQVAAVAEFDGLVRALRAKGVRVFVFDDLTEPVTPDALFPNNWVSFHADGTAVLYPMLAPNRRLERRPDILEALSREHGFRLDRVIDLTHGEQQGRFLEGTGSLVLDRRHRVAYACLSPRTDADMLAEFALKLDYEAFPFSAVDANGFPIYHTNVMLSVGERFAAVCTEAIVQPDRRRVLDKLQSTGHEVIELTRAQMERFAGNLLELQGAGQERIAALSAAAFASLHDAQKQAFAGLGITFAVAPLPTIERLGGGSARCMIAEIQLPLRQA